MFEFFFKYPWDLYRKGELVLLSGWPAWLLAVAIAAAAGVLGWTLYLVRARLPEQMRGPRAGLLWALQWAAVALLLALLWRPALSVSALKPHQNVIAVAIDDSTSMNMADAGKRRLDEAKGVLTGGLLDQLRSRFAVRLYRISGGASRLESAGELAAATPVTRLGDGLREIARDAGVMPVGAVVLLSDGGDNSGGIGAAGIAELRRLRLPVHTIGFGAEVIENDIELAGAELPQRAIAEARLSAAVSYRQRGFAGKDAQLVVRDGGKLLASRRIRLAADGRTTTELIPFSAGAAGAKSWQISIEPLDGEENKLNNTLTRLVNVQSRKSRILYIEGEPRWEMKFIRRAVEDDKNLDLVSILRTTQNKIYRQGIANASELEQGFPAEVDELFKFEGLIFGTVEASYFTPAQQELIHRFVDRRGGGVLFLGGRASLSDGGWQSSALAPLVPVTLSERKLTFFREPAKAELTAQGLDSLLMRLEDDPQKNAARWKTMPLLADYQESGAAKPGAVVLAEAVPTSKGRHPLLVTQNYGRGRTALMATGGSWRWQMSQDSKDQTHEVFWRQLLRWLVEETPGKVISAVPRQLIADEPRTALRAEVVDNNFNPVSDAEVEARFLGPDGIADRATLQADAAIPGAYSGEWAIPKAGSYVLEVHATRNGAALGTSVLTFRREDGTAENFHREQNRELLERLAEQTGGRYWTPSQARGLAEEVEYSEAGLTVRESRDLWDMPAALLLLLGFKAAEWLLRRRWGAV